MKYLIVNADDYGMSADINRGILHCFEHGIVTNTSMLVNEAASEDAALRVRKSVLPLGLHLNFFTGEFPDHRDLFGENGELLHVLNEREQRHNENIHLGPAALSAARKEFERQLAVFEALIGTPPNHVSYHYGIHFIPELLEIYLDIASKQDLPFRFRRMYPSTSLPIFSSVCPDRWYDQFNGPQLTVRDFEILLDDLPEGITEISAHPGYTSSDLRDSYNTERENELSILCSLELKTVIARHGIVLRDYSVCRKTL